MNKKIVWVHERALRIAYQDGTSSFEELLKDNSVKIHTRNLWILATEMFKIKNGIAPPLLEEVLKIANPNYNLKEYSDEN